MPIIVLLLALAANREPPKLPPYADALACAGVTQAAAKLAPDDLKAMDAAFFWSLATMDSARAAGLASAQAEADQKALREVERQKLEAKDADAEARLRACVAKVPPLEG